MKLISLQIKIKEAKENSTDGQQQLCKFKKRSVILSLFLLVASRKRRFWILYCVLTFKYGEGVSCGNHNTVAIRVT